MMSCPAEVRGSTLAVRILCVLGLLAGLPTGFGASQGGGCTQLCADGVCVAVRRDAVDAEEAEERCAADGGELLTLRPRTGEALLELLQRVDANGSLWIGLRLPAGACSDPSATLRGYEWTGAEHGNFTPRSVAWTQSGRVCAPGCVALSAGTRLWAERPCGDSADGFLCGGRCPPDPPVFPGRCTDGPCEQRCADVAGGYACSCYRGYAPVPAAPQQCKLHCAAPRCRAQRKFSACDCPSGYIISDEFCEDVDECRNGQCQHLCQNTYGSFRCACRDGFRLEGQDMCVQVSGGSPVSAGGFPWVWALAAVVALGAAAVCATRLYVVKRNARTQRDLNLQPSDC